MPYHSGNTQPPQTIGKKVIYRNKDVTDEKGHHLADGRWHMAENADDLNWKTKGMGAATIGIIFEYKIL